MLEKVCRYRRGLLIKSALVLLSVPLIIYAFSSDPPLAHTGGFGEPNCTEAGCHDDTPVNPAGGSVTIRAPATYSPGATVPITVTIQDSFSGRRLWGFELSTRFRDRGQAGSLLNTGSNVRVHMDSSTGIQYAAHSPAAQAPGNMFTYTVNWVAPSDASRGDVVFNAAGNAANGNGQPTGDRIFLTQAVSLAPSAAPVRIFAGGIVSAASFVPAPNNTAAPGALISIFGENLATATTSASMLPLPTALSGTSVTVNGVLAPLIFVSPGQINAQVPFAPEVPAASTANFVVQVTGRTNSAPEALRIDTVAPGIFTQNVSGTGPGAILLANSAIVIGAARPARPGDIVEIYCAGLGQTQAPALESGKPGNGKPTLEMPTLTIGGRAATVLFSGASPCCAGLYQINAIIPDLAAGDQEIIINIAGKQSRPGVTIRVQP